MVSMPCILALVCHAAQDSYWSWIGLTPQSLGLVNTLGSWLKWFNYNTDVGPQVQSLRPGKMGYQDLIANPAALQGENRVGIEFPE